MHCKGFYYNNAFKGIYFSSELDRVLVWELFGKSFTIEIDLKEFYYRNAWELFGKSFTIEIDLKEFYYRNAWELFGKSFTIEIDLKEFYYRNRFERILL